MPCLALLVSRGVQQENPEHGARGKACGLKADGSRPTACGTLTDSDLPLPRAGGGAEDLVADGREDIRVEAAALPFFQQQLACLANFILPQAKKPSATSIPRGTDSGISWHKTHRSPDLACFAALTRTPDELTI